MISIWMDEMGLISNPAMRKQVKNYRAYFNAKDRRLKVSTQNKVPETPAQLHMAVMSAICGLKDAQPNMILRSVFQAGLDLNNNTVYQDFVKYHADAAFWAMVRQGCGFVEEEPDLERLAIHLLLTAATRTMRQEYLAGLDSFISIPHQAYCYDFISEWLHSDNIPQLYDVARYVEDEACLYQRFEKLTVEDLVGTECFPCINEVILTKIMTEISDHIIDVDTITNTVEKRRTCVWYEPFENFYDGILQVANMQSFFKEHSAGFHTAEAKSIWKEYTESYYQMDTYYRLFHLSFQKSLEISNILLDDLFKHVVDKVEGLYNHWFLGELGNNWSDVCADELATYGKVLEVPQQEDFYRSRIQTSDTKVFVIISDAMRYEVAATMADQLQRETQSKVSISSMQSIFPSTTKFGMAALLPHKELTVEVRNDILTVLADGQSTASTYRDKVLKTEDSASVALKYNDIIAMKRAERSALVKGMDVVYIYREIHVGGQLVYYEGDEGYCFHDSETKTDAGIRDIPMTQMVYDAFRKQRELNLMLGLQSNVEIGGRSGFIFNTKHGRPIMPAGVNSFLKNIVNAYNKKESKLAEEEKREPELMPPISSHTLRHTGCTRLGENNVNPKVMQYVMGHSDAQITMNVYNHIAEKSHVENEMSKMNLPETVPAVV